MRHFGVDRWRGSRRWLKGLVQGLRGFAGGLPLALLAAGALAVGQTLVERWSGTA